MTTAKTTLRPSRRRRFRRLSRWGCLPFTLLSAFFLTLFLNLISYWQSPPYYYYGSFGNTSSLSWQVTRRFILTFGILSIFQIIVGWFSETIAAGFGAQVARSGGQYFNERLMIARRWAMAYVWPLILIRVLVVLLVSMVAVIVYTHMFNIVLTIEIFSDIRISMSVRRFLVITAVLLLTFHWVMGPFLRMRYSTALGAFAASMMRDPEQRTWAAFTARQGANLLGAASMLWASSIGVFIISRFVEVVNRREIIFSGLFPGQPGYVEDVLTASLVTIIWVVIFTGGQLLLPRWFIKRARRNLITEPVDQIKPA